MISSFSSLGMIRKAVTSGGGSGQWVAVGSGSIVATSANGNTWTSASSVGSITTGRSIVYGNGRWVVVGTGSVIATSTNKTSWLLFLQQIVVA